MQKVITKGPSNLRQSALMSNRLIIKPEALIRSCESLNRKLRKPYPEVLEALSKRSGSLNQELWKP